VPRSPVTETMAIPVNSPPMPRDGQPIPVELNLRCVQCGYPLTGLVNRVCPECGTPFDPLETFHANIKSTWEFHFTYRRPLWQYIVLSVASVIAAAGVLLVGVLCDFRVYVSPRWYVSAVVTAGLLLIQFYLHDRGGPFVWLIVVYVFLLWAIIVGATV